MANRWGAYKCATCGREVYGRSQAAAFQHHLWNAHKVQVIKSHELGRKMAAGKLTDADVEIINGTGEAAAGSGYQSKDAPGPIGHGDDNDRAEIAAQTWTDVEKD